MGNMAELAERQAQLGERFWNKMEEESVDKWIGAEVEFADTLLGRRMIGTVVGFTDGGLLRIDTTAGRLYSRREDNVVVLEGAG